MCFLTASYTPLRLVDVKARGMSAGGRPECEPGRSQSGVSVHSSRVKYSRRTESIDAIVKLRSGQDLSFLKSGRKLETEATRETSPTDVHRCEESCSICCTAFLETGKMVYSRWISRKDGVSQTKRRAEHIVMWNTVTH